MRSQWKRSEKFDTGSCHFERILKARPHIRDVIPSELAQSSKAKALLFCSKFSCELKKFGPGCKTRTEKNRERGVTFLNLPKKNKKLPKKWFEQLPRDERFLPKKLENVYVCNKHFADDCFKTQYRFELVAGNTRRRSLKKNAFRQFFNGRPL